MEVPARYGVAPDWGKPALGLRRVPVRENWIRLALAKACDGQRRRWWELICS